MVRGATFCRGKPSERMTQGEGLGPSRREVCGPWHPEERGYEVALRALAATLLLAALATTACGERSDLRIARRILENHRRSARVKPLPGAQVIRMRLSAPPGKGPAEGSGQLEWDGLNYRETVRSAGGGGGRGGQAGEASPHDGGGGTRRG